MATEDNGRSGFETVRAVRECLVAAIAEFKKSPHRDNWPSAAAMRTALRFEDEIALAVKKLDFVLAVMTEEQRRLDAGESVEPTNPVESAMSAELAQSIAAILAKMDGQDVQIIHEDLNRPEEPHKGYDFD